MPKADSFKTDIPDLRIGSYRILQPLGLGGMSSVFRAVHMETGHEVALKVLPRALAKNPTLLQRFLREAKSAEKLQHPNIASIYDRGVDQGRHYLVLEFVPGGDLHDYVQRSGVLSVSEAIDVVKQAARGLDYAASVGLIHRDVKPSNLLRTPTGQVKIIDLGLAIQSENEDERVTREGTTVGTVDYMSPEQARDSRATTIQSDMYSLGCAFYYLLTGSAPFAGGDITDKLTRHAKSPAPDPRVLRPDVPESLARIVMRLMAKNPQARFASYGELITELDAVARTDRKGSPGAALVVSVNGSGQVSVQAADAVSQSKEIDPAQSTVPSLIPAISLADLDRSDDRHDVPRWSNSDLHPSLSGDTLSALEGSRASIALEDEHDEYAEFEMPGLGSRQVMSQSDANWILGWVLTGAAAVAIVIGLDQLIRFSVVAPDRVPPLPPKVTARAPSESEQNAPAVATDRPIRGVAGQTAGLKNHHQPSSHDPTELQRRWVEPGDQTSAVPAQTYYDDATLARFVPDWARQPIPESIPGTKIAVRRSLLEPDLNTVETLRRGLDPLRGMLELAGDGPFLIDDLRIPAETRLIRARPGFRPIIRIVASELDAVRSLPALVLLENKTLVLDGLDLVVDLRELAGKTQTALFYGAGSNLTLRNCSITIINPESAPFSVIRTGRSPVRPSRIRLEGTFIRGDVSSTFELGGPADQLVANESVILGAGGPVVRVERFDPSAAQRIVLLRSVLACRGPIIDLHAKFDPGRSKPIVARILGTAIGRFQGSGISSVIAAPASIGSMDLAVDWRGEDNTYAGWRGFFASGPEPKILVAGLADLRSTWNESDFESQEIVTGWLPPVDLARATPTEFARYLFPKGASLARVARPRPFLLEKTVGSFSPPRIPDPIDLDPAQWASAKLHNDRTWNTPGAASTNASSSTLPQGGLDLAFSTDDPKWKGDLGQFIAGTIPPDAAWARIRVKGSGKHPFTPVRLADHLSLELRVEPPGTAGGEWVSWSPVAGAETRPLIELYGGQLVAHRLRLQVEQGSPVSQLIRVQDSHLVLRECQLIRRGENPAGPVPLVSFVALTTRPEAVTHIQSVLGPTVDRPVFRAIGSVFITDGIALRNELGRGLIALSQTAIAAGQAAIELVPSRVSRHRFESDLWLDRCTLTSERDLIRAGAWEGAEEGPDRPWLISSSNSAYLGSFGRRPSENVLLNGDEETLAHTVYFWQGINDALDVDCFVAAGDVASASAKGRDVVLQWINLWGPNHVRNTTGPRLSNKNPSVTLFDRLQPGRVVPSDLVLDPTYHPGRSTLDVGADLGSLGITPGKQRVRPRH